MKKIIMVPLDERPCNYNYPQMMPEADYELLLPPKNIMGDKKVPANTQQIAQWLLNNIVDADACILSMDTVTYGGIVPSRLHNLSAEILIERADIVKKLRQLNPTMKLYLFQLIMRCPGYSSSDEEPDYYDICGEQIFLYGKYTHLEKVGKLTDENRKDWETIKSTIKQEYLNDFIERRKVNLSVLLHNLQYVNDGTADFFIVPQDDAAEYGFTSMDQIEVRSFLKQNTLHLKTAMYPSADDTGLTLLARAVSQLNGVQPKIYVHYASVKAPMVIPWFEDRPLDETIKYHILALGGVRVYSLPEADIVLAVNMGSGMWHTWQGQYVMAYDVERNIAELVCFVQYALSQGKYVAVGDVATCNGSDEELLRLLQSQNLLLKIHAYAGWNTSSNTLGTCLCQSVLYMIGKDEVKNIGFLLHRYYEDMGYMGYARKYVTENILPSLGLVGTKADGKCGKVAQSVEQVLTEYMQKNWPQLAERVFEVKISMPWRRMFEAEVKLTLR